MHTLGYVHIDIKPQNILVAYDGDIALADFGLSLKLGENGWVAGRHHYGTLSYDAPEVLTNAETGAGFTNKADIWSLGVTILQIYLGHDYSAYYASACRMAGDVEVGQHNIDNLVKRAVLESEPTSLPEMQLVRQRDPVLFDFLGQVRSNSTISSASC